MIETLNNIAYHIALFLWQQSVASVPLFLFTLLMTLLFKYKYVKVLYALWIIFLARLALPVKYLISGLFSSADPMLVLQAIQLRFQPEEAFTAFSASQNIGGPELSLFVCLVFAWLSIFLLLFCRYLYLVFKVKRIQQNASSGKQLHVLHSLEKWKSVFGIKRNVNVLFSKDTVTAFNSGFFKPQIILPVSYLNMHEKKLDIILGHECIHIKRADNIKLFFQQLILMVFFFNPLVWIGSKMLSMYREQICDTSILNVAKVSKKFYGHLLLDSNRQPGLAGISTGFNINYLTIKSRLLSLNRSQPMKKPGIFLVLLCALFLFAFNTGATDNSTQNQNTDEQNIAFISPLKTGRVTSGFGKRMHPIKKIEMQHNGIDVACKKGTPVYAAADGIIIFAEDKEAWGNLIIINHADGYQSYYGQLSKVSVIKDEQIQQGQLIGLVGSSGISTGPHLHFELRKDEKPIDPETMISFTF